MRLRGERKTFLHPPLKCRPHAFWMINDTLDENRLLEQFDTFVDGGMGGVVLHAEERLPADSFLSEEWFEAVASLLKRGRKRGARIMIHDEHGWPSGRAGGRIPRDFPELGMTYLVMEDLVLTEDTLDTDLLEDSVAAFMVPREDPTQGVQRKTNGVVALAPDRPRILPVLFDFKLSQWIGERLLVFRERRSFERVNYLSADCTKAFLQLAYSPYHEHLRRHFGHALSNMYMADVELDPIFLRQVRVVIEHCLLRFHGGNDGVHDARELREHAIAHQLGDAPVVFGDLGIDEIGAQGFEG